MKGNFLPLFVDTIPAELKALRQWVLWEGVKRGDRWTKIPFSVNGKKASSIDSSTWSNFENVADCYFDGKSDGIGFVFAESGGLVGIDFDDCISDEEILEPNASAIVCALNSYTEYSVSGKGLHVIVRANMTKGIRTGKRSMIDIPVEVYPHGKYFTMTGKIYAAERRISERQNIVDYLCSIIAPAQEKTASPSRRKQAYIDNDELIKRALSARNGAKFKRLWNGDTSMHGGDDSRADAALLKMLLFWTNNDAERAECLFRKSGLYREDKWGKRDDYRKRTIDFLLAAGDRRGE